MRGETPSPVTELGAGLSRSGRQRTAAGFIPSLLRRTRHCRHSLAQKGKGVGPEEKADAYRNWSILAGDRSVTGGDRGHGARDDGDRAYDHRYLG